MRILFLLFILVISMFGLNAQTGYVISGSSYSITTAEMTYLPNNLYIQPTWYPVDTLHEGVDICSHEWLSNEPYSYGRGFGEGIGITCAVLHPPGTRCSWTIQTRKSICKKCLMHIVETDENPNPPKPVEPPKPIETYETLLEKLNKGDK